MQTSKCAATDFAILHLVLWPSLTLLGSVRSECPREIPTMYNESRFLCARAYPVGARLAVDSCKSKSFDAFGKNNNEPRPDQCKD